MRRKISVLIGLMCFLTACEKAVSENKPLQNVNRAQNSAATTPTAAPTVAAVDKTKIRTFSSKGVITKINLELVSVEMDHEKIEDFMPAMRMEFYVKEKRELTPLKVGDKVDFVLEDNAGQEKIISIKKSN